MLAAQLSSLFDQLLPLPIGEARSPRYCLREVSARCKHSAWLALDQSERELLAEALFIHRARANDLAPRPSLQRMPLVRRMRSDDLLEGLIPRTGVAGVIAPSQSGKTWLLRDLAAHTAVEPRVDEMGLPQPERVAGLPLAHGSVMYCTSEDHSGVADRFAQWIELDGRSLDNLILLNDVPLLTSRRETLAQLRRALLSREQDAPPLRLVVIDVFQDAIEGSDNDNDVVGPAVRTGTLISRLFGCAVVIAHHTPLADKTRSRGATAFENSLDVSLILAMDADQTIRATVKKNRSGRTGAVYTFHLEDRKTPRGSNAVALVDGPATAVPTEASTGRARAEAVAYCLAVSFAAGEWVTMAALRKELDTLQVFAAIDNVSRRKAKSRAIDDAIEAGWIARNERGRKITLCSVRRPPLDQPPADIEELR